MLSKEVVDILRCPKCRGPLHEVPAPHGLHCESCALLFAIIDGIPNLLLEDARPHGEPLRPASGSSAPRAGTRAPGAAPGAAKDGPHG